MHAALWIGAMALTGAAHDANDHEAEQENARAGTGRRGQPN
jgi:hypothetical protein